MELEALVQIQDFLVNDTSTAILDIGGHITTGAFLTERYFPVMEKSKKVAAAVSLGLLPDFDYFPAIMGLMEHRGPTHSLGFLALGAFLAYNLNQEDQDRNGFMPSLGKRVSNWTTSRYTKAITAGIGLHLSLDFIFRETTEATVTYVAAAATALGLQVIHNKRNQRYQEEKYHRIEECIVINDSGERFWINERAQAHCQDGMCFNLPEFHISDYTYSSEGRELLRKKQKEEKVPTIWQKVDDLCLRAYFGLKNKLFIS
jgi:hypothetical protein